MSLSGFMLELGFFICFCNCVLLLYKKFLQPYFVSLQSDFDKDQIRLQLEIKEASEKSEQETTNFKDKIDQLLEMKQKLKIWKEALNSQTELLNQELTLRQQKYLQNLSSNLQKEAKQKALAEFAVKFYKNMPEISSSLPDKFVDDFFVRLVDNLKS